MAFHDVFAQRSLRALSRRLSAFLSSRSGVTNADVALLVALMGLAFAGVAYLVSQDYF
jgi:Flp pilus assembly pilin Flp